VQANKKRAMGGFWGERINGVDNEVRHADIRNPGTKEKERKEAFGLTYRTLGEKSKSKGKKRSWGKKPIQPFKRPNNWEGQTRK